MDNLDGPYMDDVPFGEPREDYRPNSIGQGLLDIATWFDIYDNRRNYVGPRSVQQDLRAWAEFTMDIPADGKVVYEITDKESQ